MRKGAVWPLVVKIQKNFRTWKYFLLPPQHFSGYTFCNKNFERSCNLTYLHSLNSIFIALFWHCSSFPICPLSASICSSAQRTRLFAPPLLVCFPSAPHLLICLCASHLPLSAYLHIRLLSALVRPLFTLTVFSKNCQ